MESELRYVVLPNFALPSLICCYQVHFLEDGSIKVFSRNSEDMSVKYPDLVEQLPRVRLSLSLLSRVVDALPTVHQGGSQVVRYRLRGRRLGAGRQAALAVPGPQSQEAKGRQGRGYQGQGPPLCLRPSLPRRQGSCWPFPASRRR